ncbi:ComEC/Rec2 family competence protein [Nodosilinea sp. LEGE 07088]|uniref:ComEC/Rec2 family competence protein n=1 Tax=Nodosilinea sp. LEGE 07088 TaxID=2777968 RepID=UPI00187E0000|nr:ComEC/Rec2 family competence protein [Nodosilinea sp. LEGE 07088]MBE9140545.1 ComEC/Rec2 family competence protein [Nodosilinea sp. LEGE 07088]
MGAMAGSLGASAYCAGLMLISLLVRHLGLGLWAGVAIAGLGALTAGEIAAGVLPARWPRGPSSSLWVMAGLLGLLAALNYGLRYPTPGPLDISHLLAQGDTAGAQQIVWGRVQAMPRLTRSGQGQVWLLTNQVRQLDAQGNPLGAPGIAQGKLYITLPADQIEDLFPGQRVQVQGKLYEPSRPKNPNGFDFRAYLASQRCFAGLSGETMIAEKGQSPPRWALWRLRQRIARAHEARLGIPAGPLVSAMALGRGAVNVPYDIQDAFVQAGMAHTLAASGFHVSLVLGVVLAVMGQRAIEKRMPDPAQAKFIAGSLTLVTYMLITGGQPSVMRATVMGFGVLAGIALERTTKPLGCLLVAVTLLLLLNPGWIDDVGFRLSVMATLGLMVAVKPITEKLEWLPTTLATVAAVPLAAYLWTIPLSLYYFNTLTTYSILLNMVTTPLVMVISLGGMVSGLVAAVWPWLGGLVAWPLELPTHLLIALVRWEVGLPGSALATGHISLGQMFGLYGLYCVWGWGLTRRRGLVALLIGLIALGPLLYRGATLSQVTVLAAGNDAVMVVQDGRSPLLINSGTDRTAFYTVVPFLRQAGVNRITSAIHGDDSDGENWRTIADKSPIRHFYGASSALTTVPAGGQFHLLSPGQVQLINRQQVQYLQSGERGLRLTLLGRRSWLLWPQLSLDRQLPWLQAHPGLQSEVLWWHGEALSDAAIAAISPKVAIASARDIDPDTAARLQQRGIQVFCTERDGAIIWTPRQGYRAYLQTNHHPGSGLE